MKTATVRELRTCFPRLEAWLQTGETVIITKRSRAVAELRVPVAPQKPDFKKRFARGGRVSGSHRVNTVAFLSEERGA
ncbi:MAG: hypothetical protein LBK71_05480 [Verrucomicrobiales bacterium]|jgi:antitoxin (DNA-binding transcriptional repressor) of toxin-antitoxin stability system|nr:hypothetical protein [Verrucomicrobiales bacterium]